ncbi:MAG: discoidin domain-containing protein [Candidatus Didemnitutus sp.]|nr:discoidin domain-containing protein [Candidatus Didemnitutus sp.]
MTPRIRRSFRLHLWTLLGAALLAHPGVAGAQPSMLDDFETLEGWQAFPSEGAKTNLASVQGEHGRALMMEFDLSMNYGHVIARKDFDLDLPDNYQFTFDLRAESPVNNFEVKLIDAEDNVWWLKRLAVTFPTEWTAQHLRRRHFAFAWGPSQKPEIRHVKSIEFVVSSGTGGRGRILIDNLRFEPIDDAVARNARATVTTSALPAGRVPGPAPMLEDDGSIISNWAIPSAGSGEWLAVDFGYLRELGGLVLDWAPGAHATAYDVVLSSDGEKWRTAASVTRGNGGRDYLFLPEQQGRWLRLVVRAAGAERGCTLARLEVKGPEAGTSENTFFETVARDQPRGMYPKYLVPEQSYWTIVGSPGDVSEALVNEAGAIEVDQGCFTIEPFLFVEGKLVTWDDVILRQSLENGYLPIPSVEWKHNGLTLTTTAFAAGSAGPASQLLTAYRVASTGAPIKGKLFLAIRPFQVNPPWQSLFRPAGWSRIDRIHLQDGVVRVNDRTIVPLDTPTGFGATAFEAGEITEHLQRGQLPADQAVEDALGFASAALVYDFDLGSHAAQEFRLAVPFHGWSGRPRPNLPTAEAAQFVAQGHAATRRTWESMLDRFQVKLPPAAQPVIDTIKSNLAYIFINQDGPRIQPGSRNYQRSWIRDGSLTSTALLELGLKDEVRDYADWYAQFQFPSGKIPCVVDALGGDPTDEHDSHGQMIYLIMQVYHFTHDAAWLRTKWDTIEKTVRFIQSLRAQRKAEPYRTGTPEQRAFYGLVPESISHEGYSAKPMHSYWDNFFILRGLKDAVTIAGLLGETQAQAEFAAERDDCAKDLYASIALAMQNTGVDYIPGCAELGDFDATSTTIALNPANELDRLPARALTRTFDRYWERFVARRDGRMDWLDFTPYENRVIGSYVLLGQKERAHAALDYFMAQRRPAAWNHWAEVVFRDPATPRMIGDMPHTWCGSDFIRSVRTMFVYEREQDEALVLAAGVADAWVTDPAGVEVSDLPTYYGNINYTIKSTATAGGGSEVVVTVGGALMIPPGGIFVKSPLSRPVKAVSGDGVRVLNDVGEIKIDRLPATISISY